MDAFEAINQRQGILHYLGTPVEREKIDAVLQAAAAAPSPFNLQPWAFVVVTDPKLTRQLAQYLIEVQRQLLYGGLLGMSEDFTSRMLGLYTQLERVPCFILACLDLKATVGSEAEQRYLRDWYLLSLGAAVQNLMLAATALGLGTRWFSGFTLDEEGEALKRMYHIPPQVEVVAVTPLAYHDEPAKQRPEQQLADLVQFQPGNGPALAKIFRGRLPLDDIVHENQWELCGGFPKNRVTCARIPAACEGRDFSPGDVDGHHLRTCNRARFPPPGAACAPHPALGRVYGLHAVGLGPARLRAHRTLLWRFLGTSRRRGLVRRSPAPRPESAGLPA